MIMELYKDETGVFAWIDKEFSPEVCTSEELIYNHMESQSLYMLPVIYQPFDSTVKWHWSDRGSLYDFLYSVNGEGKKLLDFGPGDGWPSLIVAPFAGEVVGVDSSEKRVQTCTENARRMGIKNAKFVSYKSCSGLPFEDNSFDGIMAASSIEQTPDPKEALRELYRVLKPGGRIRICYEALNCYRGGHEKDSWVIDMNENSCKLILYNRKIEQEYAIQYGLTIAMVGQDLRERISAYQGAGFDQVFVVLLEEIKDKVIKAQACRTIHPSGKTWVAWLKEAGFREVIPTHQGNTVASRLFDLYSDDDRLSSLEEVDALVKKVVKTVIGLEAPISIDPMITAIK